MARFQTGLGAALSAAFRLLDDPRRMNPAWAPYVEGDGLVTLDLCEAEEVVVQRALIAPTICALRVSSAEGTEELRIAIDPAGVILIAGDDGTPAEWMESSVSEIPNYLRALIPAGTRLAAPPEMTARGEHNALRLSDEQRRHIAERIRAGTPARKAISEQTDLDPFLRDALLSDGARAVLDISLYVPPAEGGEVFLFHLLRRWNAGGLALYSVDDDASILDGTHVVADGDLLGTVLPLLQEGASLAVGKALVL